MAYITPKDSILTPRYIVDSVSFLMMFTRGLIIAKQAIQEFIPESVKLNGVDVSRIIVQQAWYDLDERDYSSLIKDYTFSLEGRYLKRPQCDIKLYFWHNPRRFYKAGEELVDYKFRVEAHVLHEGNMHAGEAIQLLLNYHFDFQPTDMRQVEHLFIFNKAFDSYYEVRHKLITGIYF